MTERKAKSVTIERDFSGRVPPNDERAEQSVLSTILTETGALDRVSTILSHEDFYVTANGRIYEAACWLRDNGRPVDIQTVGSRLQDIDRLVQAGGYQYLTKIIDATPSVANVEAHAIIVRDKARLRKISEECRAVSAAAYQAVDDVQSFADAACERLYDVASDKASHGTVVQAYDLMADMIRELNQPEPPGFTTGFKAIDAIVPSLYDGELIIVGGRPGMAKTAFLLGLISNVVSGKCRKDEMLGGMIFSMEMPKDQIGMRLACADSKTSLTDFRRRKLPPVAATNLMGSSSKIAQWPLWVDDTPAMSLQDIRAKVRRRKHLFDKAGQRLAIVGVDYLQLASGVGETREQEISSLSRGLKAMAKEFHLVVVALSQLNRGVESRPDKRPCMSDLRESGAIEQDADGIWMMFRPEYYLNPDEVEHPDNAELKGLCEVIVSKQRNGPPGSAYLHFDGKSASFGDRR